MKLKLTSLLTALLAGFVVVCAQASARPAATPPPQSPQPAASEVERLGRDVIELYQAGKLKEALPVAERAVALSEAASPADERAMATAYSNLGAILVGLGKFDRARAAYERALPLLEKSFGGDHETTNQGREELASALFRGGENAKAEQMLNLALASRERTLGPQHVATTRSLANLAFLYLASDQSAKRDAIYTRLLDAVEKSPGEQPNEVKSALARYASAASASGDAGMKAVYERIQKLWSPLQVGVINGRAISKPPPSYPIAAKAARAQGTVSVEITVDEEGRVIEAKAISGPRQLHGASVDAARRARFEPTIIDGKPVKITGLITYNFVLH